MALSLLSHAVGVALVLNLERSSHHGLCAKEKWQRQEEYHYLIGGPRSVLIHVFSLPSHFPPAHSRQCLGMNKSALSLPLSVYATAPNSKEDLHSIRRVSDASFDARKNVPIPSNLWPSVSREALATTSVKKRPGVGDGPDTREDRVEVLDHAPGLQKQQALKSRRNISKLYGTSPVHAYTSSLEVLPQNNHVHDTLSRQASLSSQATFLTARESSQNHSDAASSRMQNELLYKVCNLTFLPIFSSSSVFPFSST